MITGAYTRHYYLFSKLNTLMFFYIYRFIAKGLNSITPQVIGSVVSIYVGMCTKKI